MHKVFILILLISSALYGDWAEETLENLSIQEKVGQLLVVPASPKFQSKTLEKVLETYHIGGVLIKQGHPLIQIPFLNYLQKKSTIPLMVFGDAEWGLGMRMESTLSFPKNGVLGSHISKIQEVGEWIGKHCRLVGIHMNLAPVVDVNNNPNNPIIGMRSFGEDPTHVANCGALMIQGMHKGGALCCAKHFPGHGDTDVDSHVGLPRIPHTLEHLESVEFVPFKKAIESGVDAMMTGHLMVPALDAEFPATLSRKVVHDLLRKRLGFKGLIITDALNMKALSERYPSSEIAKRSLLAGHDLLLYGAHRYNDIEAILEDIIPLVFKALCEVPEEILNVHVLKVLKAKEKLGLHINYETELSSSLMHELLHPEAKALIEELSR